MQSTTTSSLTSNVLNINPVTSVFLLLLSVVQAGAGQGRAGQVPAGLLVTDEGLLQLAAGCVHSPDTPLAAATHLLTDSPHLCNQSMQRSVETRHAEQGVPVSFPYHLHPSVQQSSERGGGIWG